MEVKILWTDFALYQLEDIYDYYKYKASPTVAKKLVKAIVNESLLLELNPFLGAKEPLLADKPFDYRYLVIKNYKIIYRFTQNLIVVVSVFDCRQNPEKIHRLND